MATLVRSSEWLSARRKAETVRLAPAMGERHASSNQQLPTRRAPPLKIASQLPRMTARQSDDYTSARLIGCA